MFAADECVGTGDLYFCMNAAFSISVALHSALGFRASTAIAKLRSPPLKFLSFRRYFAVRMMDANSPLPSFMVPERKMGFQFMSKARISR